MNGSRWFSVEGDFSAVVEGKKKKIVIPNFGHGKDHVQENLMRLVICQPESEGLPKIADAYKALRTKHRELGT